MSAASLRVAPLHRLGRFPGTQTLLGAALILLSALHGPVEAIDAPRPRQQPKDVSVHGDTRIDPYFWLRERDNPDVRAHLEAEARHTEAAFAPLSDLSALLYQEIIGRIQQTDEAVPQREGAWWYSSRTQEGQQYPVMIRRAAKGPQRALDPQAPAQIVLDLNQLAQGEKFLSVGSAIPSPDGRLLAYTVDTTGARDYRLRIRDLQTGVDRPWSATGVSSFAWSTQGTHLFYVTQNAALRSDTVRLHGVQSPAAGAAGTATDDSVVLQEPDPLFNLFVTRTDDGRHLLITSQAKDTVEQWLVPGHQPTSRPRSVLGRHRGLEFEAQPQGSAVLLRVNDTGPNYRLVRLEGALSKPPADAADPWIQRSALSQAQELRPHRLDAAIDGWKTFRTHVVLQVREGGSVRLKVMDHAQRRWRDVHFPEPSHVAMVVNPWQPRGLNLEYDTPTFRLSYTSLLTPNSVYEAGFDRPGVRLLKRQAVLGGYDAGRYQARRIMAKAADGTDIPISLVMRRDRRTDGPQPLLLLGYGSYGIPTDPRFSSPWLSLLDRGVIVAIAHVRGGGDLGRHWYLQGKLDRKMNTFTDFIAAADALIAQGYTQPSQLIATGGSAGGLLMGAVMNQRPELFRAIVAEVPFVDVINTMLDESLPLTTEEFIEWGNPKVAAEYAWMRAYSPYDNLKPAPYPAVLARTAFHDSQVPYWEAAKWVARLRDVKTSRSPTLLDINMNAGHGGASGRYDALRERARVYAFMLQQWNLLGPANAAQSAAPPAPAQTLSPPARP